MVYLNVVTTTILIDDNNNNEKNNKDYKCIQDHFILFVSKWILETEE